jgi:hypothetical protein
MKKIRLIAPLAVLSLVVLAACNTNLNQAPGANVGQPEAVMEEKTEGDKMMEEDAAMDEEVEDAAAEETEAPDPFADRFDKEISCSMLKTDQARQECEFQVNEIVAQMIMSEADRRFDVSQCAKLPTEFKERCEDRIESTGVQGPVSDADLELFREATRPSFEDPEEGAEPEAFPVASYDKSKCAQLKAPGYAAYCRELIEERMQRDQLELIFISDDVEECDTLADEDLQRECQAFFGVVVETELPEEPVNAAPDSEAPAPDVPGAPGEPGNPDVPEEEL